MAKLQPLSPQQTLTHRVEELLKERILSGYFRLGERLIEARIAEQLQVSRGPVREALRLLRAEGLVQEEPRRGTYVLSLTEEDLVEIYDLRAAIECRAVRLLLQVGDASVLQQLETKVAAITHAAAAGDAPAVALADHAFHEAVCRLSGNQRLLQVFMSHTAVLQVLLRVESEGFYVSLPDIGREHQELLVALRLGNSSHAEQLWEGHMELAKARLTQYVRTMQEPMPPLTDAPSERRILAQV